MVVRDSTAKAGHLVGAGGDRCVDRGPRACTSSDPGPWVPGVSGLALRFCLGPSSHSGKQAWSSLGMSDSGILERGWLCPFKEKFKH